MFNDNWYRQLEINHGEDFCIEAGYFEEQNPYIHSYKEYYDLPKDSLVIQYSGAFYPFHEGHLEILKSAVESLKSDKIPFVVIHADHSSYRTSKGKYNESDFRKAFDLLNDNGFDYVVIFEDDIPDSCSRNFTKLYSELLENNNDVWFLCGGDRAYFALTFRDEGKCIVAGRSNSESYVHYKYLENDRIKFIYGNNNISSTQIRNGNSNNG